MIFSIPIRNFNINFLKILIKYKAKEVFTTCELTAQDLKINQFLQENYNLNIRQACNQILSHIVFLRSGDTLVIKIIDPKLDKLARIISYGNGTFGGSNILRLAFTLK